MMTRPTAPMLFGALLGSLLGALMFFGLNVLLGLNVNVFSVDAPTSTRLDSYAEVIAASSTSVVSVEVTRLVPTTHPLLNITGASKPAPPDIITRHQGSALVIAPGILVTSHHLVRDATAINVTGRLGQQLPATLIGADEASDLAVLKLPNQDLTPIRINTTYIPRVGDVVLAIGNPFLVGQSVSQGIISAVDRSNLGLAEVEGFIQTDAAVNPGSSGGALINSRGELVGVITGIVTRDGGFEGVAFAIPTATALSVAQEIVAHGRLIRGYMGIVTHAISDDEATFFRLPKNAGQFIARVDEDSPAREAGLKAGDLLIAIDGIAVGNARDTQARISALRPGTRITIDYVRRGEAAHIELTLREKP